LRDPHVSALIDALWVAIDPRRDGSALLVDGLLLQMAGRLQDLTNRKVTAHRKGGLAPWQLRRAVEYLAARLDADVRLADVAAEVGLSPFHFARAFRVSMGEPPHRHHLRLRIENARRLLATTSRPVIDIALECGFSAPQAFARAFRRLTGSSPSEYRQASSGAGPSPLTATGATRPGHVARSRHDPRQDPRT
jgi:AraC family transcriptional regulator